MAFSGVHITCGFALGRGREARDLPLHYGQLAWSQTMASAGTTAEAAPSALEGSSEPVFTIISSADIYLAVGSAPDATSGARRFLMALEPLELIANPGDKVAWILA